MTKSFVGDLAFLSNFHRKAFWMPSLNAEVKSGEHAYQALKTLDPSEQAWVLDAPTAREAKRRGFRITRREDWDEAARLWAMTQVIIAKFEDEELRDLLYETDGPLVELNDWCDTYYGVCMCAKHGGQGKNMLGELLMMRRSLRNLS